MRRIEGPGKYAHPESYRRVIQEFLEEYVEDIGERVHEELSKLGYDPITPVPIEAYEEAVYEALPYIPGLNYDVRIEYASSDKRMIVRIYWKLPDEDGWTPLTYYYDENLCFKSNGRVISDYHPDAWDL
ncbi:MAG: hypothetical protein KatS3mg083_275 [Candidatus Dojkabacteria bacterium]|nr:MAG: hypothetical protein KatS3mg083_275 [Candidatus Dojkabacteria bacterium]